MSKPSALPLWDTTQVNATVPDATHKSEGWLAPAGIPEKPPFQTFNYWQNEVYRWIQAINDLGVVDYDILTDYVVGAVVLGSDNRIHRAIVANGPSSSVVNPVGTTGTWLVFRESAPNLLYNPEMLVNQRAFAGGALGAGIYGYDRWKAVAGGGNTSATAAGVVTITSGGIEQVLEDPGLADRRVVLSAVMTSGTLDYDIEGETGSLTGAGLQTDVIDIPGGSTGNITVELTVTGATVFKNLKLEPDNYTPFVRKPIDQELAACKRYYTEYLYNRPMPGYSTTPNTFVAYIPGTVEMASVPTFSGPAAYGLFIDGTGYTVTVNAISVTSGGIQVDFVGTFTHNNYAGVCRAQTNNLKIDAEL